MSLSLNYAQFGFLFQDVGFCVCLCLSFTSFTSKYETSCECLYVKRNARNRIDRVISKKQACNCVSLMHLIFAQNSKLKLTVNNLLPPKRTGCHLFWCMRDCMCVYVCTCLDVFARIWFKCQSNSSIMSLLLPLLLLLLLPLCVGCLSVSMQMQVRAWAIIVLYTSVVLFVDCNLNVWFWKTDTQMIRIG